MEGKPPRHPWLVLLALISLLFFSKVASLGNRKKHIVYLGDQKKDGIFSSLHHLALMQSIVSSTNELAALIIRNYGKSFNAFSCMLTEEEASQMATMESVISVFPNRMKKLHTTKSWDFIGFPQGAPRATMENDIIIGMIDTGIWPESPSFNDSEYGPPPSKWKGSCQNLTCNNKIIGARYYPSDEPSTPDDVASPRDYEGHGTHTASTVAGSLVEGASFMGFAQGAARGGVPSARIAVYKVCWTGGCSDESILAAFDDAIADGVDIISISLGHRVLLDYFSDSISIGSFHAMKNGILTSVSAGNEGPELSTTTSVSPWTLSVAASTIDRSFTTRVQVGSGKIYEGISINTFDLSNSSLPLIYGGDVPNTTANFTGEISRYCLNNSLDARWVKGKIVLCDFLANKTAFNAGPAGVIIRDSGPRDVPFIFPLAASRMSFHNGSGILFYMKSTSAAFATLNKSTEEHDPLAPYVPLFSSRGPNQVAPGILKPDITAPGVSILAAWSPVSSPSRSRRDSRKVQYNIISGTSMACPHATAAAAYVKSFHPNWSPAAIKSALLTTATPMGNKLNTEAEFAYGAGQINPIKAAHPGLIYDAGLSDYVKFLCGQGYPTSFLRQVTGDESTCPSEKVSKALDLNYPSFALAVSPYENIRRTFHRNVTSVGLAASVYRSYVTGVPDGLKIHVVPNVLSFHYVGQQRSFELTVKGTVTQSMVSASLVWYDGFHHVRSPVVVYLNSMVF